MRFFITMLSFIVSASGVAQVIKGRVVDAVSRQPLENVSITSVKVPSNSTITNHSGNFFLKGNEKSFFAVSFIGYKPVLIEPAIDIFMVVELQRDIVKVMDAVVLQNNSAAKFSTLSNIDLDLKPVRNTQEIMRLVPGLFIAQHAGGGKAEQLFLRGFDIDHGTDVKVSVDGLPVNMVSHAHGQGYADAHFIIPETINNIDFGAGPYYAGHGNLNTAGYVSFSTFNNISKSIIQLEAGRFNTFRTMAMFDIMKKNKDKQSAYLAGEINYTDGPTINEQKFKRFNVFGKYNLALSTFTQLSFAVSAFSSNWNASGQVPKRAVDAGIIDRFGFIDPSEGGKTSRYNANVKITHTFKNNSSLVNQAYYSHYAFNLFSNFTFFLNDDINGDGIQQSEKRNVAGYISSFTNKKYAGNTIITSTIGAGFRHDATMNSRLSHVVKRVFLEAIKRGNISETNTYAYLQEQLSAGKWLFEAGGRIDHFRSYYNDKQDVSGSGSENEAIVSPKLNIQYTLSNQFCLYVKAGKGFHSNDTRVVVANNGLQTLPAAYGADLGFILKSNDNFLLNVAAWYLFSEQEFVYVGDAGIIEPGGKSRRQGIDLIARYQFNPHLFANMNMNITEPRALNKAKGMNYIPLAPTLTSTGGLFYKRTVGISGSLSYRYIKSRPANEDNSIQAIGYMITDGSINYTKPCYEIGIAFENIFNVKWNEAQFATESKLKNETVPVTELHYTPGNPFFARVKLAVFF